GDEETREKIMKETQADKIKELGREVKGFDPEVWNQHKFNVVVKGNLAKFGQNPSLLEFLKKTGSAVLVEASPYDNVWGIGMKEGDKDIEDAEKWFGINLLGFALMVVRDQL
ncbi:MAG: NADAR family protein, partial [Bacteroidales bacterium]|nr:NADAR family protein [Bacteroidales bacterium]